MDREFQNEQAMQGFDPDAPVLSFFQGMIALDSWSYQPSPRKLIELPWCKDDRTGTWTCDALHYQAFIRALADSSFPVIDQVPQWRLIYWPKIDL